MSKNKEAAVEYTGITEKQAKRNLWFFPLGTFGRDMIYNLFTNFILVYVLFTHNLTPAQLMAKPNGAERLMKKVVKGMLPKTKLGDKLIDNLYVYAGTEHKHEAQQPKAIDINSLS